MARLLVEKQDGTNVEAGRLTTGQYLTAWAMGIAAGGTIRPTTAKTYEWTIDERRPDRQPGGMWALVTIFVTIQLIGGS